MHLILNSDKECPACNKAMERFSRSVLMRVLIGSKLYGCGHCRREYLYFLGFLIPIRW